ncbi:NmrA family NAD(P)-binding protein [Gordonia zhaorongruii]|uniref:NmrA family NAD(P)-binding protein n=1 Tax=Gordonia zhaorongruii TaxID=2597659 RepID=UPI001050DA2A|nr:NmrA family NAD(P)-binding protein [Gordonia zhaorongruii]
MTHQPDILVVGATGTTGRAVGDSLTAAGTRFRAMSRTPQRVTSPLATPVRGDLDDAASVRDALVGVRAAYLVTPSSEAAERQQTLFIDQAMHAGVEHLVLLSQLGADAGSPVRFLRYHGVVEDHASRAGIGLTALRPNLFMQGLLAVAGTVRHTGTLPAPIGSAPVSIIDARDIGDVAARAVVAAHPMGVQTLTGPEALTHAELADRLGTATGQTISFDDVDPRRFEELLTGVLPSWQVAGVLEDYAHYARGEAAEVSPAVPDLLGRPARQFSAFANEHADSFRAS